MIKSNVTEGSFGNNPTGNLEAIDAYDKDIIDKYLNGATKAAPKALSEQFPDIPADQIKQLLNDPSNKQLMADKDLSFDDLVKAVRKSLPPKVDLSNVTDLTSMSNLMTFSDGLREHLGGPAWQAMDKDLFSDTYNAYEKYKKSFSPGGNWPEKVKGLSIAGVNGLLSGTGESLDSIMDAANKLGVTKMVMRSGATSDFIDWIAKSDLPDELKKMIYGDLVEVAGQNGYLSMIKKLIALAEDKFNPSGRKKTIMNVLNGFTKPYTDNVDKFAEHAKTLIDTCDSLDASWRTSKAANGKDEIQSSRYLQHATMDALEVLKHDARTRDMVMSFVAFNPIKGSYKQLATRDYIYLVFR